MQKLKNKPLVSIIINCHNGEEFLLHAIKSVLKQTYKNWEIIFFDNNSNDNSVEILKKFKDKRIKIYIKKNKSLLPLYQARNLAIQKAKGTFITFLDVDDTWEKNKLAEQIHLSNKFPSEKIFYSNYNIFDQELKKSILKFRYSLPSGYITQSLLNDYCIGILTIFINKKIFKKNKFNEKYNVIGDFDLLIKLSEKFKIISSQKPLANYRVHKSNYSKNIEIYLSEMLSWYRNNKKKLKLKKISLLNIQYLIFKLRIKILIKNILSKF